MIGIFADDITTAQVLLGKVTILSSFTVGKTIVYEAKINAGDIFLIVISGYGKAQTAFAFAYAQQRNVNKIIGIGNCGSLKLCYTSLGDIAISTSSIQYDVDYSRLGYPKTLVPGLEQSIYISDDDLIDLAKSKCVSKGYDYYLTKFGSGDQFVASAKISKELRCKYDVEAVENEAGVVGELAYLLNIPYVFVKGVSNFADYNAPYMYDDYKAMADERSNNIAYEMLLSLT